MALAKDAAAFAAWLDERIATKGAAWLEADDMRHRDLIKTELAELRAVQRAHHRMVVNKLPIVGSVIFWFRREVARNRTNA